jgi:Phytochelatin synthase
MVSKLVDHGAARAGILLGLLCSACGAFSPQTSPPSGAPPMATPRPKYGPNARPLSLDHGYLRGAEAPDFWRLVPYYSSQSTERSCSLATATMIVNAARAQLPLQAETPLATEAEVLRVTGDRHWADAVGPGGHGLTLDELATALRGALTAYHVAAKVRSVHAEATAEGRATWHKVLAENETSASDLVVVNFVQGVATGDADVGHAAPVGAFDDATRRVLILDPDRQWYEPYWTGEGVLYDAMERVDAQSGNARGYLIVHFEGQPDGQTRLPASAR